MTEMSLIQRLRLCFNVQALDTRDLCSEAAEQIEALTAQVGVLREALKESYIEFYYVNQQLNGVLDEDGEPLYLEGKSVTNALAKAKNALASTPESALSAVRKAERERVIALWSPDDSATDLFDKIRAMGDE